MRAKLTLKLDDLSVDSFDTTVTHRGKGTVFGEEQQCTCPSACTCPGCPTCDVSCGETCGASCWVSCDWTCAGNTCENTTCDRAYCELSQRETNCNHICY